MIPAEPHFHGDRHIDRAAHRREEPRGVIEVAHQGRTRFAAGHGLGRAAHVDVDGIGAVRHGDTSPLGHRFGRAAGELHHMRVHPSTLGADLRFGVTLRQLGRRDHLGDHGTGTEPLGETPHMEIGDAR